MPNWNNNTIIPKACGYGCGTRIIWDTSENAYFEIFTKKKHNCPNRSKGKSVTTQSTTNTNKPNYYYNKKSYYSKESKSKMSNSFELLTEPISEIQKKYEILSDIVSEYNGKVQGSQRDRDPKTGLMDLMVYYEVPEGKREEAEGKFGNFISLVKNNNNNNIFVKNL